MNDKQTSKQFNKSQRQLLALTGSNTYLLQAEAAARKHYILERRQLQEFRSKEWWFGNKV
jgi:hypothetical protein